MGSAKHTEMNVSAWLIQADIFLRDPLTFQLTTSTDQHTSIDWLKLELTIGPVNTNTVQPFAYPATWQPIKILFEMKIRSSERYESKRTNKHNFDIHVGLSHTSQTACNLLYNVCIHEVYPIHKWPLTCKKHLSPLDYKGLQLSLV